MKIIEIKDINAFQKLEEKWNSFLIRCSNNDFFLSYTWLYTCIKNDPPNRSLNLLLFEENDTIVGAAPVSFTRGHLKTPAGFRLPLSLRRIHFIGDSIAPRCDILTNCSPEPVIRQMVKYLDKIKASWEIAEFRQMPEGSENLQILENHIRNTGFDYSIIDDSICPYRNFDDTKYDDITLKKYTSSKRLERLINKGLRELREKGKVDTRIHWDFKYKEIEKDISAIENESWKKEQKQRLFSSDMYKFTTDLIRAARDSGELFVILMYFNNEPIAYNLGFIYANKYYSYSAAYKQEYSKYKPGYILHRETIMMMDKLKLREHDFLMGHSRYKKSFCNNVRQNKLVRVFNDHPASRLLYGIYTGVRPLYKQLKHALKQD
ncbi:MAG: GNAT family N-acetyltransferase [candidate division Zixibacteria bacterium]|nr:GNAT family N-acetyltransferase [candidate division Zixibacteria bacterium]